MTDLIEERIVRLGPEGGVVGVVTLPPEPRRDAPALVLMNAGIVHRIGPHRLNVKIARAFAREGYTSVRVDLSGVGDSAPPSDPRHSGQQALRDLQAAMTHLEQTHGIRQFIVFGICSGAVNGYWLAQIDERVVGLVMFDGYMFATWKTHLRRRVLRFRALPWSTLARKPLQWLRRSSSGRDGDLGNDPDDGHFGHPTPAQFRDVMDRLARRGTAIYLVVTGSFLEYYNYASQMRDNFGDALFLRHARYDYMPDVDHTVTQLASQRKVIAALRDWLHSVRFGHEPVARVGVVEGPLAGGRTGSSIQESVVPP